ncbi:MAG: hypothetical protein Ct9H300mP8_02970 [Gammaproteobacteria bacterium]|nr:MAG: hypothetical protein Ct9H300mP8_02970 [Gammaproteobacteria bacterium]
MPFRPKAQDWRFICVRDQAVKDQMHEWAQMPWRRYQARYAGILNKLTCHVHSDSRFEALNISFNTFAKPPCCFCCGLKGSTQHRGEQFPAIQNLLLGAQGFGSFRVGFQFSPLP